MKSIVAVLVGMTVVGGVAQAQTATDSVGYVEGIVQSAFGNVTSQSFGAEGGYRIGDRMHVFVELGRARDTAPKTIGTAAQIIAGYLTQVQSAPVTFSVRQPLAFGVAGIRYSVPYSARIEPYVMGGVGIARVTRDVAFTVAGTDVTSNIGSYGVALGSDLSGTESTLMISAGGGVSWTLKPAVFIDAGYRYGHALTDRGATSVNRIGLGVGLRF
jgi:opacity protein-like surface antigen